jgi:hypothetical protein
VADLFKQHEVLGLGDIPPFGEWLQDMLRNQQTLAIVPRERTKRVCLSSRDDSWELDFKNIAGPLAAGQLKTQVLQLGNLKLAMRNVAVDLPELTRILADQFHMEPGLVYRALAPMVVGDLTAASHCINQVVTPHGKFRKLDQDAFEIALLLPQYEHAISRYYAAIGLPKAKLHAERQVLFAKATPDWYVVYHNLWVRVLAYYSGDPTLGYAFQEERDPFEAVGRMLKISAQQAEVFLLWHACGRHLETFNHRFPARLNDLPQDILEWNTMADRHMPALSHAVQSMVQSYYDTRTIETRYQRKLRPGAPIGEAVAFRVFGTVEELVSVAAVSICNNRTSSDTLIVDYQGGPAAEVIRLAGTGPKGLGDQLEWLRVVRELSGLGNPLGVLALKPQVFQP